MFAKVNALTAKLTVFILILSLQGCPSMSTWNFKPSDNSGQSKGYVKLILFTPSPAEPFSNDVYSTYPGLQAALSKCKTVGPQGVLPFVAPVIGKLIFDLYMDKQARDLAELEAAATKSYSAQMTIHADILSTAVSRESCFVLTRVSEKEKVEFVSVLKLEPAPAPRLAYADEAFLFKPIYVAAHSAVAITRKSEEPKISVSMAITVSGLGPQQNRLPAFSQIGEASVTIPNLQLGEPVVPKSCSPDKCPASGPIPLDKRVAINKKWLDQNQALTKGAASVVPIDNITLNESSTLLVGIGIVENGDTGVQVDAAKSELAAIKEALGPMISDILKDKYK